jgi:hypothetical protein
LAKGLSIHCVPARGWSVTHFATGYRITFFAGLSDETAQSALACAEAISGLVDWERIGSLEDWAKVCTPELVEAVVQTAETAEWAPYELAAGVSVH